MTEITRVPLQPVAKGALTKLWIGTALAVALGGAVAYGTRDRGLEFDTIKPGSGASPTLSDYVLIKYTGKLSSGKVFDSNDHAGLAVQGVIPGFSQALMRMQKGGHYHVVIPARLGYGAREQRDQTTGEVSIPANSDLVFDIDLLDMKTGEEFARQRLMMQQLQQMQGAQGGAIPGGAAPGGAMPGGAAPDGPPDGVPAH